MDTSYCYFQRPDGISEEHTGWNFLIDSDKIPHTYEKNMPKMSKYAVLEGIDTFTFPISHTEVTDSGSRSAHTLSCLEIKMLD